MPSNQGATCKQHFPLTTVFSFSRECDVFQMQIAGYKAVFFGGASTKRYTYGEIILTTPVIFCFAPEPITGTPACRPALGTLQLHSAAAAADLRPGAAAAAVRAWPRCLRGGHRPLAAAPSRLQGLWMNKFKRFKQRGKMWGARIWSILSI